MDNISVVIMIFVALSDNFLFPLQFCYTSNVEVVNIRACKKDLVRNEQGLMFLLYSFVIANFLFPLFLQKRQKILSLFLLPFPSFFLQKRRKEMRKRTSSLLLLFKKGRKKGKKSFEKKRAKNQGIEPFSPSSTSSFWERKERERVGNKVEMGKKKDLVRNEQGLMFLLYFFLLPRARAREKIFPRGEKRILPLNIVT